MMLRVVGRRFSSAWAGAGAGGGAPDTVVPSLHLPPYFELREVGKNFRYKSDPDWVIDIIHRDCVREEGLTYISEAATYTVTFFQIINYCAKRGFELSAYGVHGGEGPKAGKRWAVLSNKQILQFHQNQGTPPHELAGQLMQGQGHGVPDRDVEAGLQTGKYIKWGDQVVNTERKMDNDHFAFYEQTPHGGVVSPGSALHEDVIHQEAAGADPAVLRDAAIDAETTRNIHAGHMHIADHRAKKLGQTNVMNQYMGDDLSLKMPTDEKFKRGL